VRGKVMQWADVLRTLIRGKERYIGVAAIFLLAIWYNLVVSPVDGLKKESFASFSNIEEDLRQVDISENMPEKRYKNVLQSVSGDWHRISIVARSYDSYETLSVIAVSETGREKSMGVLELEKGAPETYHEFLFASDDAYRDIVIRRTGETELDRWRGGDVAIGDVSITRLAISNQKQADELQSTIRKESQSRSVMVRDDTSDRKDIFFPGKSEFLMWGVFESPGERMISVSVSAKKIIPETNGKYVIELRGYDSSSKVVDKKILSKHSFTESEALQAMEKNNGLMQFEFPERLHTGLSYVVGIRWEKEDGQGGLEFAPIVDDAGFRGPAIVEIQPDLLNEDVNRLLFGAKVEDIGPYMRYAYHNSGEPSDFFNIDTMTESVKFSSSDGIVLADAKVGEFFSYEIDTLLPFTEVAIFAEQFGEYEDQISLEYSFDGSSWTEIPYEQDHKGPQRFSARILDPDSDTSTVFVAVRYAKEEDTRRKFGLSSLEITAKMPK
jgi:hypothetical protein